ncbi:MAG: hypothetical protein KDA89_15305, partial [Planctomycetaceae bacterium]|nr:hypothetical protein [Planctomycetaceae bacterium]
LSGQVFQTCNSRLPRLFCTTKILHGVGLPEVVCEFPLEKCGASPSLYWLYSRRRDETDETRRKRFSKPASDITVANSPYELP